MKINISLEYVFWVSELELSGLFLVQCQVLLNQQQSRRTKFPDYQWSVILASQLIRIV